MRVELANVAYRGGVGVNALATMCKLIGWLHHHQNTEQKKINLNQNIICEIPPKMHMICGHCVARISVGNAKVSLATPKSMQHMFNLRFMG